MKMLTLLAMVLLVVGGMKIRVGGSSGIADILWEEEFPKRILGKLKGGRR